MDYSLCTKVEDHMLGISLVKVRTPATIWIW
jgi:hypothetical protein